MGKSRQVEEGEHQTRCHRSGTHLATVQHSLLRPFLMQGVSTKRASTW